MRFVCCAHLPGNNVGLSLVVSRATISFRAENFPSLFLISTALKTEGCPPTLCDIYLLQLGFHVAVVGKLVQNRKETAIYKRRNNKQNNTKA